MYVCGVNEAFNIVRILMHMRMCVCACDLIWYDVMWRVMVHSLVCACTCQRKYDCIVNFYQYSQYRKKSVYKNDFSLLQQTRLCHSYNNHLIWGYSGYTPFVYLS